MGYYRCGGLVDKSCPTLATHGLYPARILRPWDSLGKNTGVGCHFLLQLPLWMVTVVKSALNQSYGCSEGKECHLKQTPFVNLGTADLN